MANFSSTSEYSYTLKFFSQLSSLIIADVSWSLAPCFSMYSLISANHAIVNQKSSDGLFREFCFYWHLDQQSGSSLPVWYLLQHWAVALSNLINCIILTNNMSLRLHLLGWSVEIVSSNHQLILVFVRWCSIHLVSWSKLPGLLI